MSLARPFLIFVNALLVIGALVVLISGWLAPTVVFMLAFSIALLINYPEPSMQTERINAHAESALLMASVLFAAGAFTGVMKESKCLRVQGHSCPWFRTDGNTFTVHNSVSPH